MKKYLQKENIVIYKSHVEKESVRSAFCVNIRGRPAMVLNHDPIKGYENG